jgi:hypothetical protein
MGPTSTGPTSIEWVAIALGGIILWCVQSYLSSMASGWHTLVPRFRSASEYLGETLTIIRFPREICMRSWMRYWRDYTNVVQLAPDADGLQLSVFFPFRIGHPPLLIPWREIDEQTVDGFWRSYVVLILGRTERIPMRISKRVADDLRLARTERQSMANCP